MSVAVGQIVGGRYLVEAEIGRGAMGVVYRARHTGTGRPCALKFVHPHLVSRPELCDLFVREAQVSGAIGPSPHIVDVFDAAADEIGGARVPYIAMELLEGETLEALARRGPLPPTLVRTLLEQLADALDQAHRAGVVHRDIKPGNLFVARDRHNNPLLKVMDFGIAKVLEQAPQHTATAIGTPAYAAPEQLGPTYRKLAAKQGIVIAASVSPATDVWPLGLIAYELLTGLPTAQFWTATTAAELPAQVSLEEQPRPTDRAGDRARLLPPGFDAWFARTLHKDAAERWPSAGQAVAAFAGLTTGGITQTVVGGPPPGMAPAYPAAPWGMPAFDASASAPRPWTPVGPVAAHTGGAALARSTHEGARRRGSAAPVVAVAAIGAVVFLGIGVAGALHLRIRAAIRACEAGDDAAPCARACDNGHAASCARHGRMLEDGLAGVERSDAQAVERYRRACDRDDQAGCAGLAAMLDAGRGGLAKDPKKAADLARRACDRGDLRGCAAFAGFMRDGRGGVVKDLKRAVELSQKACDGGEMRGCFRLAVAHRYAEGGLAKDTRRAAELFQKACDGAVLVACNDLGVMNETGQGSPKDDRRAAELYQKACDGGEMLGCNNLALFLESGRGGLPKDDRKAVEMLQMACVAGNLPGCHNLGRAYEAGRGGLPKDERKAVELYQKACDGGDAPGCAKLGWAHRDGQGGLPKDDRKAVELYKKACDASDAGGCRALAWMLENGRGVPERDDAKAAGLYQKACDGGDWAGCNNLGFMLQNGRGGLAKDERRAVELYRKSCDAGEMFGCNNLGWMYQDGKGGLPKDERLAVDLYRKACDADVAPGCSSLGWAYAQGRGIARDRERGIALLRKGCSAGNSWGCDRLKSLGVAR